MTSVNEKSQKSCFKSFFVVLFCEVTAGSGYSSVVWVLKGLQNLIHLIDFSVRYLSIVFWNSQQVGCEALASQASQLSQELIHATSLLSTPPKGCCVGDSSKLGICGKLAR